MPVPTVCPECQECIEISLKLMIDCLLEDRELGYAPSPFICQLCLDSGDYIDDPFL